MKRRRTSSHATPSPSISRPGLTGDSGDRNNEPEADAESAHGILILTYGGDRPAQRVEPKATGSYSTGDLDHDGRDDLLISVPGGARILYGSAGGLTTDGATTLRRNGGGEEVPASERPAQLAAVQDFDQDGRADVVLGWSRDGLGPSRWWVIEGDSDEVAAFTDAKFAD
ncbi:FG-GAP repeat domain-containing protein [Streptomyces europaeiscabiei]|uniref:FG-GAP repeat domain-containing protein n=1 Tax=Streptomyces europaeiscabiei TaxID=146819 RepID=UPI0038F5E67A